MKKIIILAITFAAISCNQPKQAPANNTAVMPEKDSAVNSSLAKLEFASKNDMSCGMPLSAGLSDTVTYKGKLYGFCSAECKADFVKNADSLLKAK
ncbi:MAG: YHS domain-containing protein [Ferruginibacter sp.]